MYVGMNRIHQRPRRRMGGVPHVRGDEPVGMAPVQRDGMRSPCTWG